MRFSHLLYKIQTHIIHFNDNNSEHIEEKKERKKAQGKNPICLGFQ